MMSDLIEITLVITGLITGFTFGIIWKRTRDVIDDGAEWEKMARKTVANPRPISDIKRDIADVMERINNVADEVDVPITDSGPWVAEKWPGGRIVIQSDQFEHDVALVVNGDFADDEQKMSYARGLAAQINAGVVGIVNKQQKRGE